MEDLDDKLQEIIERAWVMLETQGKLTPDKTVLFIHTGAYGAAASGGVLAIGQPGLSEAFIRVLDNEQVEVIPTFRGDLVEGVLDAFRRAMILEDLAHAQRGS